jgi:HEAT repeat protein
VCKAVAEALGRIRDDRSIPFLIQRCKKETKDPVVCLRSADYLARLKIDSAIDEMSKAFDIENHWWMRVEMDRTLSIFYAACRRKREEAESAMFLLDRSSALS